MVNAKTDPAYLSVLKVGTSAMLWGLPWKSVMENMEFANEMLEKPLTDKLLKKTANYLKAMFVISNADKKTPK
jgi:ABC-type nitrate/sulfonate/bicarbonate transport system ATPase subunit